MYRKHHNGQLSIEEFHLPFGGTLDQDNRWVNFSAGELHHLRGRQLERACYEDLAFRVLTANQQPDHSRISEFRRRNLDALKGLFVQILRLCQKAGW